MTKVIEGELAVRRLEGATAAFEETISTNQDLVNVPNVGQVPSMKKRIDDAIGAGTFTQVFKNVKDWRQGEVVTTPYQRYYFPNTSPNARSYTWFSPLASLSNPVMLGASPIGDQNWQPYDVSSHDLQVLDDKVDDLSSEVGTNSADIQNLKDNQHTGVIVFDTYAALSAYTPQSGEERASFKVANDPSKDKNGYYSWDGSAYVKDASLVSSVVEKSNESDAVSGAAVVRFVDGKRSLPATPNLYNQDSDIIGKYMTASGVAVDSANYQLSDYIPVKGSTNYALYARNFVGSSSITTGRARKLTVFDKDLQVISGGSEDTLTNFTTPVNAAYVRLSLFVDDKRLENTLVESDQNPTAIIAPYHPTFSHDNVKSAANYGYELVLLSELDSDDAVLSKKTILEKIDNSVRYVQTYAEFNRFPFNGTEANNLITLHDSDVASVDGIPAFYFRYVPTALLQRNGDEYAIADTGRQSLANIYVFGGFIQQWAENTDKLTAADVFTTTDGSTKNPLTDLVTGYVDLPTGGRFVYASGKCTVGSDTHILVGSSRTPIGNNYMGEFFAFYRTVAYDIEAVVNFCIGAGKTRAQLVSSTNVGVSSYLNKFTKGDFILGDPEIRSGSEVVTTVPESFKGLGLNKAVKQRASGNDFAITRIGEDLQGKYLFSAMYVNIDNPSDDESITVFTSDAGNTLSTPPREAYGKLNVEDNTYLTWSLNKVTASNQENVLLGFVPTPTGERLFSGMVTYIFDAYPDTSLCVDSVISSSSARSQGMVFNELTDEKFVQVDDRLKSLEENVPVSTLPKLTLNPVGEDSFVTATVRGNVIKRAIKPFPESAPISPQVFNFNGDYVNDALVKGGGDDIAPVHVNSATLLANHSYYCAYMSVANHGKTTADIGSIYSNGGKEYVLVGIASPNHLQVALKNANSSSAGQYPTGTYVYVSGGASTNDLVVTGVSTGDQFYPPAEDSPLTIKVDDLVLKETSGEFNYTKTCSFSEAFRLLPYDELISWYISKGAGGTYDPSGSEILSFSVVYEFDHEANCTIYMDYATVNPFIMQDIMGIQAANVGNTDNYYIPKTVAFEQGGQTFNYSLMEPSDKVSTTIGQSIKFTSSTLDGSAISSDRWIVTNGQNRFAMGFLPEGSAGANRATNVTTFTCEIRGNTDKIYPRLLDIDDFPSTRGDHWGGIAYRNVHVPIGSTTCFYTVRTRGNDYLYMDWHDVSGMEYLDIPEDLNGREFEVVESRNADLLSYTLAGTITVNPKCLGDYGYLVLRVKK